MISTEIQRLQQAKADLATSIAAKGVTVPSATTIDGYAALVDQIQQGGSSAIGNEVEYLESTGTQWIETELVGKQGYDFEYKVVFTTLSSTTATGVGGEYESYASCYIGMVRTNNTLAYHYKNTSSPVGVMSNIQTGVEYTVQAHLYSGEQYFIVNGTKSSVGTLSGNFTSSYKMRLFSVNSTSPLFSYLRLYYCKIYNNGTLVRDYIPVRIGQVGYLYDKENDVLYGNKGTGNFVLGNDKT